MPMTIIPRHDLLVGVGSVVNMVGHASCMRITDMKPVSANPIAILTVAL
jgi:hypothetical protein